MNRGAIVLCGGKSTRMDFPKATLPIGNERMLQRTVRILSKVLPIEKIVVVGAWDQLLPPLPEKAITVFDRKEDQGPLEGLATGLSAIENETDVVFVTGCDAPLLKSRFILKMFELLKDSEIAIPVDDEHRHTLAGCYRTSVFALANQLLATGEKSMKALLDKANTILIAAEELREVDPDLDSLKNINTPEDYFEVLSQLTNSSATG